MLSCFALSGGSRMDIVPLHETNTIDRDTMSIECFRFCDTMPKDLTAVEWIKNVRISGIVAVYAFLQINDVS